MSNTCLVVKPSLLAMLFWATRLCLCVSLRKRVELVFGCAQAASSTQEPGAVAPETPSAQASPGPNPPQPAILMPAHFQGPNGHSELLTCTFVQPCRLTVMAAETERCRLNTPRNQP